MADTPQAVFIERKACINCGQSKLTELSRGRFGDNPVRGFIENDPWGESPLVYISDEKWILVCCDSCGQMFHKRVLDAKWNDIRFARWMSTSAIRQFESIRNSPQRKLAKGRQHVMHAMRLERMTRELVENEDVRVLDFGCGFGEFLMVCTHFGFLACGIDRSPERRHGAKGVYIHEDVMSLKAAPEGMGKFHAITLFEVLEHVDEPRAILRLVSDLLVQKGVLVLETPDCTGVTDIKTESDYRKVHPLDHINAFTPKTLLRIAQRTGFREVSPPLAVVTCAYTQVFKSLIKPSVSRLLKPATQLYLRKTTGCQRSTLPYSSSRTKHLCR